MYCPCCTAKIAEIRAEKAAANTEARAQGYIDRSHIPEHKAKIARAAAAKSGRVMRAYIPMADVEARRRHVMMVQAERRADVLRRKFWRAEGKRLREVWWADYKHSEEYLRPYREQARRRYINDPDRERLRSTKYKHSHPHEVAKWEGRRKALAAAQSDGTLTRDAVGRLFANAKRCPYCGSAMRGSQKSLDHLDPLSDGGLHGISNVAICCRRCNIAKSAAPFIHWLDRLPEPHRARAAALYRKVRGCEATQASLTLQWAG
jgi:5-methylcytosine-specific restriction endonuclease McrA